MYNFLTGEMVWISFGVFAVGLTARLVMYIKGLDWQLDRVTYRENTTFGVRGAARSVFKWLLPLGTYGWRKYPLFTANVFIFHGALLLTPVFLAAHNIMLRESWGISFWMLPETAADMLTLLMIGTTVFLALRRIGLPEVRILTTFYDMLLLAIAAAPFVTGFAAHHQVGSYPFWLNAHIISGEIMLMAIPFTKLSHFLLFFLTRIQIGMDFGIKRGGMKGKGIAW